MISAVTHWLSINEAFISSVVGLGSLVALAWGLIKIIYQSPSRSIVRARSASEKSHFFRHIPMTLFIPILNLGIGHHINIEDRIAARTVNFSAIGLIIFSVALMLFTVVNPDVKPLGIIHGICFLACLLILRLQAEGKLGIARWLFLFIVMLEWTGTQIYIGPWHGNEYVLAAIVVFPILLFKGGELQQRLLALILIAAFALLTIISSIFIDIKPIELHAGMHLIGYYLVMVSVTLLVFFVVNFYVNFSVASFSELELEHMRTEELVNSIFPEEVLRHINAENHLVAESHEEATVIFVTVGGFESLYQRISAVQLVELMSEIFVKFDELLVLHGVEKINTLGTHYVGASGVFNRNTPEHAAVARFALDILKAVQAFSEKLNHRFTLRAGISTGQVISGVIGSAHPCFDIWGETVELANSMSDTAMDNSIVVNESAFWRLKDMFEFAEMPGESGSYLLLQAKG